MNKPRTPIQQLTVDVCRFILLQEKLNRWLAKDPVLATRLTRELLAVEAPDGEAIARGLLVN